MFAGAACMVAANRPFFKNTVEISRYFVYTVPSFCYPHRNRARSPFQKEGKPENLKKEKGNVPPKPLCAWLCDMVFAGRTDRKSVV